MHFTRIKPSDPQNDGGLISFPCSSQKVESTLYLFDKTSAKWINWQTSVSSKVRVLKTKFGVLFAITESGEVFVRGKTDSGQCGVVQEEALNEFRNIQFGKKSRDPCPHGIKYDDEKEIIVTDIDCTSDAVYFVDSEGRIWTYGKGKIAVDSDDKIQVSQVKLSLKAFRIYCGKNHCIAFCEEYRVSDHSISTFDESSQSLLLPDYSILSDPSPSIRRKDSVNPKCDQCVADSSCRLSLLMKIADESASVSDTVPSSFSTPIGSLLNDSSSIQETPKKPSSASYRLKSRLEKLRSNFRGPVPRSRSIKETSKTTWYTSSLPLGSSLGSFGSPKSTKKDDEGVEMSTMSVISRQQSQPPPAITDLTGSASFSYVNLENFIGLDESSLSTTPESSSKRPSVSTSSDPSSATQSPIKSKSSVTSATSYSSTSLPLFGELWSWGNNQYGQLGHADTIVRKEPKRIQGISGPILKVTVGDDHNVVLMATGEVYVWGSNSNGQLKQINQSFLDSPTLWRLGAESCILDVEADSEFTGAIVAGQSRKENSIPLVYFFGRKNSENSSTIILSGVEKSGFPLKISMISEDIWIRMMTKEELDSTVYGRIQAVMKIAKFSWQLKNISRKLINSNHVNMNSDVTQLMINLNQKTSSWAEIQSGLAADFLRNFCNLGESKFSFDNFKFCKFKDLCRAILELHFAYIEAVSFRCFNDITLESDLVSQIDKFCLDHNTDSSVQQKKLRYLFRLPFDFFQALRPVLDSTLRDQVQRG
ncbi:hypothetical protein FO519_001195 [Halicephalobus sp. NKZ332]|nr:hypothetical protein FO519_001195 [Halicephalobus sp. NKZ332]